MRIQAARIQALEKAAALRLTVPPKMLAVCRFLDGAVCEAGTGRAISQNELEAFGPDDFIVILDLQIGSNECNGELLKELRSPDVENVLTVHAATDCSDINGNSNANDNTKAAPLCQERNKEAFTPAFKAGRG